MHGGFHRLRCRPQGSGVIERKQKRLYGIDWLFCIGMEKSFDGGGEGGRYFPFPNWGLLLLFLLFLLSLFAQGRISILLFPLGFIACINFTHPSSILGIHDACLYISFYYYYFFSPSPPLLLPFRANNRIPLSMVDFILLSEVSWRCGCNFFRGLFFWGGGGGGFPLRSLTIYWIAAVKSTENAWVVLVEGRKGG